MRVLAIYATAGAGHRMAAEAVYHGLKTTPGIEPVLVDSLDHAHPYFKQFYSGSYTMLITKFSWLWGFFFWLLDLPFLRPIVMLCRRIYNSINAGKLHRFLEKENFDYIISTQFLTNEVAAAVKRSGKIKSKIISIVTDYDVHSIWLANGIDMYCVATEWTKKKILALGVPPEKVVITGIPTHAKFSQPKNISELRAKAGLKNNVFTVLVATGSFGIGPIEEIIHSLPDIQIMVVCGHNKKLFERLSGEGNDRVKIYGLVNNMDELMAMSDALITKPGGLSISEALVTGLPMVFFNAIPGQETNNVKVLKHYGIGHSEMSVQQIPQELKRMQASEAELSEEKKRIRNLARPNAVQDIIKLLK